MRNVRLPRIITRQGWLLVLGSSLSILAARLLGSVELFVLGVIGIGLVLVAVALVRGRRFELEVSRTVAPPRVHAGGASQVTLSVTNRSTRRTPVLRVFDPVTGTRGANLLVAPLQPEVPARAAYRLPTERRGIVEIGPMKVQVTDPFGLCTADIPATGVTPVTSVYVTGNLTQLGRLTITNVTMIVAGTVGLGPASTTTTAGSGLLTHIGTCSIISGTPTITGTGFSCP